MNCNILAEVSFRNLRKPLSKLPSTLQALYSEVRDLYNSKLPTAWIIEYLADGTKKYLNEEDYQNILAGLAGDSITLFIEEQPEFFYEKKKGQIPFNLWAKANNPKKNLETLLQDLSSIDDEEESKNGERNFSPDKKAQGPLHSKDKAMDAEKEALMEKLKEGLEKNDLTTEQELAEMIDSQRKEYENLFKNGKKNTAATTQTKIQELVALQELFEKLKLFNQPAESSPNLAELEKELNEGLEKNDLANLEELQEMIVNKKQEYENFEKKGKKNLAAETFFKIQELEHLQELFAKIQSLKQPSHSSRRITELEEELKEGLEKNDLSTQQELLEMIDSKRKEYENLLKNGKKNTAATTQTKIQELEHLQLLFEQLRALRQPAEPSLDLAELEKEFRDGLEKNDLANLEELTEMVQSKRQEHENLEKKGKKNLAATILLKIQELEHLQTLFAKIQSYRQVNSHSSSESVDIVQVARQEGDDIDLSYKEALRLGSLYKNAEKMPNCVEKTLLALIYYCSLKGLTSESLESSKLMKPESLDQEILQEFENLKERVKIEDNYIPDIENKLQKWKIKLDSGDFEKLKTDLTLILDDHRPLNIQELFRLLEEGENTSTLIQNEDVFLLLGGTGCGKSTTIHFLAGSKMAKDGDHIYPVEIPNSAAKNVTTSASSKSETRYISAVPVELASLDPIYDGRVLLCDSPGFGDTAGAEVDIANAISIYRAVSKCKSVKPVLIISHKGIGDRMQGLKQLAHILVGMIPEMKKYKKSIAYLFTKYPPVDQKSLNQKLIKLRSELTEQEKSDEGFITLFSDLIKQTANNPIFIDPINGKPAVVLDEMLSAEKIPRPGSVFKFSINEESKGTLLNQAHKNQQSIMSAAKRFEYELVEYKLGELKKLSEVLDLESLKKSYAQCVSDLSKHLREQYKLAIAPIEKCLIEGNVLTDAEVKQYQICIKNAELADRLRDLYLYSDEKVVSSSAYTNCLNERIDSMMLGLEDRSIDDPSLKASLDKAKLLANSFEHVEPKYREACSKISQIFKASIEDCKDLYSKHQYEQSGFILNKIQKAIRSYETHLNPEKMLLEYENLKAEMKNSLVRLIGDIQPNFSQEQLTEKGIKELRDCIERLEAVKNSNSLQQHFNQGEINALYNDFINLTVNYVKGVAKRIGELLDVKKEKSLAKIEIPIQEMSMIKDISGLGTTVEFFYNTFSKITDYILNLKVEILNELAKVSQENQKINYQKIYNYLTELENAQWIRKYKDNVYTDLMDTVKEEIFEQFKILKDDLDKIPINLENAENIKIAYQKVCRIYDMRSFEHSFKELTGQRERIEEAFQSKVNHLFTRIETLIPQCEVLKELAFRVEKVMKAIHFLEVCRFISNFGSKASELLDKLHESLRKCSLNVNEDLKKSFKIIEEYVESLEKQTNFSYEDIDSVQLLDSDGNPNSSLEQSMIGENQEDKNKKIKRLIEDKIRVVSCHLQDLDNIREYELVYKHFSAKMLKDYENRIEKNLSEMSQNMKVLIAEGNHVNLNSYIQVARALSEFDQFLSIGSGERFRSIAIDYHTQLVEDTKLKKDHIIDKIKAYNFEEVKDYMDGLSISADSLFQRQLQRVKTLLNYSTQNLLEETYLKVGLIRFKDQASARVKVKEILQNLKHIQKAKEHVSQYLEDGGQKVDKCKTDVADHLSKSLLDYLTTISKQIEGQNFSKDIGERVEFAEEIKDLVGPFLLNPNVENKIKSFEGIETRTLKKIEDKFLNMKITDYALSPPKDVWEQFEGKSQVQFVTLKKSIERSVHATFDRELDSARTGKPISVAQSHLENVKFALNHLPETMKTHFQQKFKECQDILANRKKEFTQEFEELQIKPELITYRKLVKKCQDLEETSKLSEIENYVDGDLAQVRKEITKALDKNIQDVQEHLIKIMDYVTQLGSSFPSVKLHWQGVEATLLTHIKKLNASFVVRLRYPDIYQDGPQVTQSTFKEFLVYIDLLLRIKNSSPGQDSLLKTLVDDSFEKLKQVNLLMKVELTKGASEGKEALQKFDMKNLGKYLKQAREWEPLMALIRETDDSIKNEFCSTLDAGKEINHQKMTAKVQDILKLLIDKENDLNFINNQTKGFTSSRESYYLELQNKLKILEDAKEFLPDLENYITTFYNEVVEIITHQKSKLANDTFDCLWKMWTGKIEGLREICEQFSLNYNNLVSSQAFLHISKNTIASILDKIDANWNSEFSSYIRGIEVDVLSPEKYTDHLKIIKTLAAYIQPFKETIDTKLNEILEAYKAKRGGAQAIAKLGTLLNNDRAGIGQRIIEEHQVFKGYSLSLFNTKTQKHDSEYVLKKMEGTSLDTDPIIPCPEKDRLKELFNEYKLCYEEIIRRHLKPNPDLSPIISNIKLIAENKIQRPNQIEWDHYINSKIPLLMAYIFALWTLKNSGHYFEMEDLNNRDSYLLQPHAAQVISIFRLLGVGAAKEDLRNHLVQIRTGEGKSITLAVTAAVLALFGFDVSCACYSQYLCDRDYESFREIFDLLGVTQHIHYGTFNKLCEDALNQNGEVRKIVDTLITKGINEAVLMNKEFDRSRILLIDEVDVFFSQNFYGELYAPSVNVRSLAIAQLLDWIWAKRNIKLTLNMVKESTEYQNCFNWFKDYGFLVEEAVKAMLFDLREYPSHQYIVKEDKIGYIDGDTLSFQTVNRYQTVFAYYHEHEKGRISQKSLNENKWIRVVCGNFSYAEIPKQFSFIMGVTGTLKTLTKPERKVIEDIYKIYKNTYTPSVFGANDLTFNPKKDVRIESDHDYYPRLAKEISKRLGGKNLKKRAVLVFFESALKLEECRAAPALANFRDKLLCLTEEANPQEKDSVIRRATCSGQVTFLTKTFGRGTDFVINDQDVVSGGGLHVIQTFVSDEYSEEVQIKGRTARQGDDGSFSMVLLESSLEKFLIFKQDLKDVDDGTSIFSRFYRYLKGAKVYKTRYEFIDERRNEYYESQYDERQKYVVEALIQHEQALDFMKNIREKNVEKVQEFLRQRNKGVTELVQSKTIVLMDATISMGPLLLKAKNTVGTMFDRVVEILREENLLEDSFQMQFVVYRNYSNNENLLLQSSIWETKPDNLRSFMEKVNPAGGQGNEAIEVGLWHANNEHHKHKISQVILIGDAPANTNDDVANKRERRGETYWSKTKFAKKTFWKDEAEKLKNSNIPIHAFYVDNQAEANFREIATMTKGRCEFLDVNSPAGADMLTDLISEVLLNNIGQQNGRNDLVDAYRKKFIKSYS